MEVQPNLVFFSHAVAGIGTNTHDADILFAVDHGVVVLESGCGQQAAE